MKSILAATALTMVLGFGAVALEPDEATYLTALYRHLHAHPELSFQETETAKRMAQEFRSIGFEVTEGVGQTGLFAVYRNGEGPTVMLRADMDALPVREETGLAFASTVVATTRDGITSPVMHACGHDVHMTGLVGTARALLRQKDQWKGTLVLIAQPAEELGLGALAMLRDGLYERAPLPDANIAFHVAADLPAGEVAIIPGFALANVDSVDITVRGIGGHGAYPHTTKDPIVIASHIVTALQTLVSRETSPLDSAVVTVGAFNAGTKHNIISNEAHLMLTVRSYSDETRQRLLDGIKRIAEAQARSFGMPDDRLPVVEIKEPYTPSTYNDPRLADQTLKAITAAIGDAKVVKRDPVMGGEDFSQYGRTRHNIPSVIYWVGAADPQAVRDAAKTGISLPSLHSAKFAPKADLAIPTAVASMTAAALAAFQSEG
jgi:amidohydrolase